MIICRIQFIQNEMVNYFMRIRPFGAQVLESYSMLKIPLRQYELFQAYCLDQKQENWIKSSLNNQEAN